MRLPGFAGLIVVLCSSVSVASASKLSTLEAHIESSSLLRTIQSFKDRSPPITLIPTCKALSPRLLHLLPGSGFATMAILCCCPQLRHKRSPHIDGNASEFTGPQGLPARPPPARLPPPVPDGLVLSPQSTAARSSLTNPLPGAEADASIHLAELVIEDSEDENGDDELAQNSRNRSTSTLEAVKARIRRHLSQDSLPRRLSESEQQIARRAQVKRLMRKRIQEELQNDNNPVVGGSSSLRHLVPPPIASVAALSNGPRDTIEFTVDEVTKDKGLMGSTAAQLAHPSETDLRHILKTVSKRSSARSDGKENHHPESRPISLRDWVEHDMEATYSDHHRHVRQRSSLHQIPASPQLQLVRVASLHDARALASLRLSLSAGRLADLLTSDKSQSLLRSVVRRSHSCYTLDVNSEDTESLKPNRVDPSLFTARTADSADEVDPSQVSRHSDDQPRRIPKSSSLIRDESPVGLWLRAQSQQFCTSTASPLHSERLSDDEACFPDRRSPADQPCACAAIVARPQLESSVSSRCSPSATLEQTAASAAIPVGTEAARTFSRETKHIRHIDRDHSSAGASLPAMSSVASHTPASMDIPLQNVVRKGFAGMALPSFRC